MKKNEVKVIWGGRKKTVIPKMGGGGNFSLGVDESVTISGSLDTMYRVSHNSMSAGDKLLAIV